MFSFDKLVAERDALKAKGVDTKRLDEVIAKHKAASDEAMKQLNDRQSQERGERG